MRNKGLSFYKKKKKISQELLREIFSWIFGIALSVFMAEVVVIFLGKSTRVVGMSIEPTLENGQQILATISGKLRRHFIRILPGDKVTIELSPSDLPKGSIIWRDK